MTLQQLKYVITVAETGTITEAAKKLYISQPSLTNAIHDLEKEMNVEIFHRTNKGIDISKEGEGVRDRATLFNLLIGLNGYTVCSGVIDRNLNGEDIIAVPLQDESEMQIGYLTHRRGMRSRLGETYLAFLIIR